MNDAQMLRIQRILGELGYEANFIADEGVDVAIELLGEELQRVANATKEQRA